MGSKERKERERQEMHNLILDTAGRIVREEGLENLSVRKIANAIDYSPAIIYHYFKDKDAIVNQLLQSGYRKIVGALASVPLTGNPPLERLRLLIRAYIDAALQMPDEFLAVQLNSTPAVLEVTSWLFEGAAAKKPALEILVNCLLEIYGDRQVDGRRLELTAQVISVSTFGLITRLIVEKNVTEEERAALIEHFTACIVNGIVRSQ